MEEPCFYRNKAIYPVNEDHKIGFYKKRTHDIIPINIEIDKCKIHTELSQQVAQFTANNFKGEIYNEKNQKGILRNIMIREGLATKELMLVLVQTTDEILIDVDKIVNEFIQQLIDNKY